MRLAVVASVLLVAIASLAGCPDRTISKVPPAQQGAQLKKIPVSADIDILFVIDNSASTADKQAQFATNFPMFITALDSSNIGRPNLHIGVTSTSVSVGNSNFGANCANGDDGLLQNMARGTGCTAPTGRYIIDIANGMGSGAPVCGTNRTCNYAGETLAQAFTCIAQLGQGGCGFEAQLEAMKRALDGSHPENAGFVRNGAFLAVVILTDEDDCSISDSNTLMNLPMASAGPGDFRCQPAYAYKCDTAISTSGGGTYNNCSPAPTAASYLHDPIDYYNFLTIGLNGMPPIKNAQQTVVALIGGGQQPSMANPNPPPNGSVIMTGAINMPFQQPLALLPSCTATVNGNFAIARPALRIYDFVQQFGDHGLFETICQADYSQALTNIANLLFNAISPCLEGPVDPTDIDPNNPGLQLDCTVSDVVNEGTSMQTSTPIPPCKMSSATMPMGGQSLCYFITPNPTVCTSVLNGVEQDPSHLQINFVRTSPPAVGTVTDVSCAVSSTM
jgi:hypothetical protein